MARKAGTGQWVNVTPLVFLASSAVGFLSIALPAFVGALLPSWAQRGSLVLIIVPPALACLGWSAYARHIARTTVATRVGWLAFTAALAWPACILGTALLGALLASSIPGVLENEHAAEGVMFLLFLVGCCVATVACWLLSRTIMRALWPRPDSARVAA
jgi:hypothetical protein